MAYQILARKWRPQDFSTLIGQKSVVTALTNALRAGRIAPAYLFSGIRGVGKTTVARILAKALNCEAAVAQRPCSVCCPCVEIGSGADLDVLEIDAATYSKVEQIRELTDSLRYGPARDRYKVVVLDEVHRLSRQAFDALLKIVEEPPPHLVFVFATTEIDAVPATILSRCQEYHFRRVSAPEVAEHLAAICAAEQLEASPTALRLIARAGEGSVRDAVALLDQLATLGAGHIGEADAAHLLGGLDTALFQRLLAAILDGRSPEVLAAAERVSEEGWDPRRVYAHFLAYCRDALRLALGADPTEIDLPRDEADALAVLAGGAGYENLLRLMSQLLAAEAAVRRSESSALACEISWLRAAELPKLVAIESVLAGSGPPPREIPERPAPQVARPGAAPRGGQASEPRGASSPPPRAPAPETPTPGDGDPVSRFLEELSKRKPSLAAQVEHARPRLAGQELVLSLGPEERLIANGLAREANRRLLDEAVAAVFGPATRWRIAEDSEPGARPEKIPPARPRTPPAAVAVHPAVQSVLEIFGGRVATVETRAPDATAEEEENDR